MPIYSGGLGILAGDHCKEASDLGVPLVGVGFMYPQGYFRQRITPEGWQEAAYAAFNRDESPIHPALTPSGDPCRITVEMGGSRRAPRRFGKCWWEGCRFISSIRTCRRISPENRALSARLYGGDQEMRLCQEILLGIGGVRMLRTLGIAPSVWHANEGHSAFLTLERVREMCSKRVSTHAEASEIGSSEHRLYHPYTRAGRPRRVSAPSDGPIFCGYWEQIGPFA